MEVKISLVCGDVSFQIELLNRSLDFFSSRSHTHMDTGTVRDIMDRLWSVRRCYRNHDVGWGEPRWDVYWVPVDKEYTKDKFVGDLLNLIQKEASRQ